MAVEHILNCCLRQRRDFLRHGGDAPVRRALVVTAIRFQLAGQQVQQRALAAAIAAGQADLPAAVQGQVGVPDQYIRGRAAGRDVPGATWQQGFVEKGVAV